MPSPIGVARTIYYCRLSGRQQQRRLLVSLAAGHDGPGHDGPGHARNLVGERDRRHPGRSALHQSSEPWPVLRAVALGIADDGCCAGDQQPSQVSITLLGDAAEPILAARRVLLRHQPDPGR